MKPEEKEISTFLKNSLPSPQQSELACGQVLQRLRSESVSVLDIENDEVFPTTRNFQWAAAMAVVAAGLFFLLVSVAVVRNMPSREDQALATVEGRAGDRIQSGQSVHTTDAAMVLVLRDGSRIEVRSESELSLDRAPDGLRIRLKNGGVIVNAAKQHAGHLYVQTKDVTVSVVGTVFLVSTEQAGSRVAVIQGEVQVQQGAIIERLAPGQQVATNPLMESHPVREQISWSREAPAHMALLQQSAPTAKIQGAPAPKQQFEAASLKPLPLSRGSIPPQFLECKGVDGIWSYAKDQAFGGEGTDAPIAVPLGRCIGAALRRDFVAIAYDIRPDRISGDEGDAGSYYQLEAKADDPSRATKGELRQMLQALAIDRFKLKAHRYTEEGQGYVLGVAKNGVKFKEASGDEEMPREQPLGRFVRGAPSQLLPILIQGKCSLRTFAQYLSGGPTQGLPVIDKTDLPGIYDISLSLNQVMGGRSGPRGGGATTAPQDMWDPPLAKALEDQLGLRLESVGKVPVEYLAVDHVEKPTEN